MQGTGAIAAKSAAMARAATDSIRHPSTGKAGPNAATAYAKTAAVLPEGPAIANTQGLLEGNPQDARAVYPPSCAGAPRSSSVIASSSRADASQLNVAAWATDAVELRDHVSMWSRDRTAAAKACGESAGT